MGKNLATRLGDANGVLKLRRELAVARHSGPAVGQHLHMRAPEVDHRLDGEQHAGLQRLAFADLAVVQDVGAVVEDLAKSVPAEIAHDAAALGFGIGLDGGADMPGGSAGLHGRDAALQGLVGDADEPLGAARDAPDRKHAARVAVPTVDDERHIDVDDVALAQGLGPGNAVTHDVVDRSADRLWKAAVIERGRVGAVGDGKVEDEIVERLGRDAGLHMLVQHVERLGGELAGLAHAGVGFRAVQLDLAVALDPVMMAPEIYAAPPPWPKGVEHPVARRRNDWTSWQEMFEAFKTRQPYSLWRPAVLEDYCRYGLLPKANGEGFELACPPAIEASIYTGSTGTNIYALAKTIEAPVLVLRAKAPEPGPRDYRDFSASPTWAGVAGIFPHGRDVYLPELTHFIPMQEPELTAHFISGEE